MNHSIISTGGNVYNDYIADFDESGRVIIAGPDALYVYANDRDYQIGARPLFECYVTDELVGNLEHEDDATKGYIGSLTDHPEHVFIRHASGVIMSVLKQAE